MTYNELVIAVSDYCENTFPTVDMNIMIKQAEQRIYNTVQIANLRANVTGTITTGTGMSYNLIQGCIIKTPLHWYNKGGKLYISSGY